MAFKLFKREPVKNELDFAATIVVLPKSNKEMTLEKLVNDHDAILNMHGYANGDHMVKVGDKDEMSVNDLLKKHMELSNEMEEMKKSAEEKKENEGSDDEDDKKDNESDEDEESKKKDKKDKKENEDSEKARKEDERKENARKAADDVRSAPVRYLNEVRGAIGPDHIELSSDKVARGKARYGSQR